MTDRHPVIENILRRRDLKVPTGDDRKIALVLYGGLMRSIRGGGATIALEELGLRNAFDEIYGYSGGFPNACYFLSGDPRTANSIYYEELTGYKFLNFFRLHKMMNIDYLIKLIKDSPKKLNWLNLASSKTKLFTSVFSLSQKELKIFEVHDFSQEDFYQLMAASISLPYLNLEKFSIEDVIYRDAVLYKGSLKKHLQFALDSGATDVLVIHNHRRKFENWMANTKNVYHILPPARPIMRRWEKKPAKLIEESKKMGKLVKQHFGFDEEIKLKID